MIGIKTLADFGIEMTIYEKKIIEIQKEIENFCQNSGRGNFEDSNVTDSNIVTQYVNLYSVIIKENYP